MERVALRARRSLFRGKPERWAPTTARGMVLAVVAMVRDGWMGPWWGVGGKDAGVERL